MWRQNGAGANSGALFLASSTEKDVSQHHDIADDGYDAGRDAIVAAATAGPTSHDGTTYVTTAQSVTGLLDAGAQGINHGVAQDGVVVVLTVKVQGTSALGTVIDGIKSLF
jgi:hypothetical protein